MKCKYVLDEIFSDGARREIVRVGFQTKRDALNGAKKYLEHFRVYDQFFVNLGQPINRTVDVVVRKL